MTTYKVSIVVVGSSHPGAIVNLSDEPKVGNSIKLGSEEFLIQEILELMPPKGDFYFLHLPCVPKPSE